MNIYLKIFGTQLKVNVIMQENFPTISLQVFERRGLFVLILHSLNISTSKLNKYTPDSVAKRYE